MTSGASVRARHNDQWIEAGVFPIRALAPLPAAEGKRELLAALSVLEDTICTRTATVEEVLAKFEEVEKIAKRLASPPAPEGVTVEAAWAAFDHAFCRDPRFREDRNLHACKDAVAGMLSDAALRRARGAANA